MKARSSRISSIAHTGSQASLFRQVLTLALPAVGEQVLSLMVNLVNTMLVGHLGAAALAAVGLSGTVLMISLTFFSAVATGATALIAQAVGAGRQGMASRVLGQATTLAVVMGLGSVALMLPLGPVALKWMGAEPESAALGAVYMRYLTWSLPFLSLLFLGNAALRGAGDTRTPMMTMAGVNIVNIVLSYGLIRGIGPLPELGVAGAGIAAMSAQTLGGLVVLYMLKRGRVGLRLARIINRPDRDVLRQLVKVGLPAGGESILMRFAFLSYSRVISSLGTVAYATYIIAQRIESFNTMPAFGFGIASTTLAGQALGAGDAKRARASVMVAARTALGLSMIWAMLSFAIPEAMMGLFTNDPDVIAQGITPLRFVAIAQPIMSIAFCLSGGLRGAGDTRTVMVATGIGAWLVRVPVALLSVMVLHLGLPGVQASMMLDWLTRCVFLGWRFHRAKWDASSALIGVEAKETQVGP